MTDVRARSQTAGSLLQGPSRRSTLQARGRRRPVWDPGGTIGAEEAANARGPRPGVDVRALGGLHEFLRHVDQEGRGLLVLEHARDHPATAAAEEQPPFGAGHADVEQPSLLLDVPRAATGVEVRQQAVLQSGDEDGRVLEALGAVQGHHRDAEVGVQAVRVADQGDVVQEVRQRTGRRLLVRLAGARAQGIVEGRKRRGRNPGRHLFTAVPGLEVLRGRNEFAQVVQPLLPLLVALPVERVEAGRDDRPPDELGQRLLLRFLAERLDQAPEVVDRTAVPRRQLLQRVEPDRVPKGMAHLRRPGQQELLGPAADASPRLVQDPPQRQVVPWIVDHPKVRGQVLDLGALVEPNAGDQTVRNLAPQHLVLDRPCLRVGPYEDGHVAELEAVGAKLPHLPHDPARLVLLIGGEEEP